tara:strand:+ start:19187 stop:20143 length:957 start_codon:yes stop_codon:yes gene_type:complete
VARLRRKFENLNSEVTLFSDDVYFSSQVASYGLAREVGTVNDELARFVFDADSKNAVTQSSFKAEFVEWRGLFGVRIYSSESRRLTLRTSGFYDVVHPELSFNSDGTLHSLYVFPDIIHRIAKSHGVDLVLVKTWGMNSIFGGFDPSKGYYQTNFWEIENNDSIKFADLIRHSQIAFLGTHDLIAHIAGIDQSHWPLLKTLADRVYHSIHSYFKNTQKPTIASLILPYTLGVVLDDLAQPPSYSSLSHMAVLEELIARLGKNEIAPNQPTLLTEFPKSFQTIIDLSRTADIQQTPELYQTKIQSLVQEILSASITGVS